MSGPRQNVIGYGRVSTEEQESNYSMDAQRTRFEVLCKQNQWKSLGFFPETGSGTSVLKRPVLCKLLEQVRQGGIDALWVKETDRLSRPENLGDLSIISQTLETANTHLIVDTRVLDLAEDNSVLMLDFEGVLAKHFRRQLLRNMNRGKTRKAEMGRKSSGADIFGYTTNENGEYAPDPTQSKVVQLIFELAMNGNSLRQIIAELKSRGIQTVRGRANWSICVLGSILRNDIYLGIFRFHKTKQEKDVDGSRFQKHRESHIVVGSREKPNHPPLIDPRTFDIVQQKLQANRKKNSVRLYMATGLLRCPACNATMHVKYSSIYRGQSSVAKYSCSKKPNCTSRRWHVAPINDQLWQALVELFTKPERIHELLVTGTKNDLTSLQAQLAAAEREQKTNKEKQERLLNLYLEGNVPQATYVVKSSQLEAEGRRLGETRARLTRQVAEYSKREASEELVQTLRLLSRSHRRFTEEQKTKVFRSIVKEARLTAAGVELEMYVQPTQNVWWKYRQKKSPARSTLTAQTVRIRTIKQDRRGVQRA